MNFLSLVLDFFKCLSSEPYMARNALELIFE
jgi:hypothetical protein